MAAQGYDGRPGPGASCSGTALAPWGHGTPLLLLASACLYLVLDALPAALLFLSAVPRGTVTRLLSRRRLILILDLDHTLLNSVHLAEVGEDAAPKLAELQQQEEVGRGRHGARAGRRSGRGSTAVASLEGW